MTEVMVRSDMEYEKRGRYITGQDRQESRLYSIMDPIVPEDVANHILISDF